MENETRFIQVTNEDEDKNPSFPEVFPNAENFPSHKKNLDTIPKSSALTLRTILLVCLFLLALLLIFLTFIFNDSKRPASPQPHQMKNDNTAPSASRQTVVVDLAYLKETTDANKYALMFADVSGKSSYIAQSFKLFQTAENLSTLASRQVLAYADTTDATSGNYETALWVKYSNRAAVKIFSSAVKRQTLSHPKISPDGKTVTYALTQLTDDGKISGELWQIDTNGENKQLLLKETEKLTNDHDTVTFLAPLAWQNETNLVLTAVSREDAKTLGDIFLFDIKNKKLKPTAAVKQPFVTASLSNDGQSLVYIQNPAMETDAEKSKVNSLLIINFASDKVERLPIAPTLQVTSAVWSNDDQAIVFAAYDASAPKPTYEIFNLNVATQKSTSLFRSSPDHILKMEKGLPSSRLVFTDQDQTTGKTSLNTLNLLDSKSSPQKIDEAPTLLFLGE